MPSEPPSAVLPDLSGDAYAAATAAAAAAATAAAATAATAAAAAAAAPDDGIPPILSYGVFDNIGHVYSVLLDYTNATGWYSPVMSGAVLPVAFTITWNHMDGTTTTDQHTGTALGDGHIKRLSMESYFVDGLSNYISFDVRFPVMAPGWVDTLPVPPQPSIPLITDVMNPHKGTHSDIGPLGFAHKTYATYADVDDNTEAGDELYIYNPTTHPVSGVERFIAYNVPKRYWRDWHLANEPSSVQQGAATSSTASNAIVTCWNGQERYFQFVSPYPIAVITPSPSDTNPQPNSTRSTDQTGVAAASILNIIDGSWSGLWFTLHSTSTADLFIYHLTNTDGEVYVAPADLGIQYTPGIDTWADHGSGQPHDADSFSTSINALGKRLVACTLSAAGGGDVLFIFEDPYY
jgi:hypothetical protein